MRFPLEENNLTEHSFWQYRDSNNRINNFYTEKNWPEKITSVFYLFENKKDPASLTCVYQDKKKNYFTLFLDEKGARRVKSKAITKDKSNNWRRHPYPKADLYVCGNYERPDLGHLENLDRCQFSLVR